LWGRTGDKQYDSNPATSTSRWAYLFTVGIEFDQDISAGKPGAASAKIFSPRGEGKPEQKNCGTALGPNTQQASRSQC